MTDTIPDHVGREAVRLLNADAYENGHWTWPLNQASPVVATVAKLLMNPPATDVAALVEAAKETNAALERDGDPAFAHLILANKAALAPFTKGQNDE